LENAQIVCEVVNNLCRDGRPFMLSELKDACKVVVARKEFAVVKRLSGENFYLHPYGTRIGYNFMDPVED